MNRSRLATIAATALAAAALAGCSSTADSVDTEATSGSSRTIEPIYEPAGPDREACGHVEDAWDAISATGRGESGEEDLMLAYLAGSDEIRALLEDATNPQALLDHCNVDTGF